MLKELLLTLKEKIKLNWKKSQKQDPQNQGQNEAFKTLGLNLLSNFQPVVAPFKRHEDAVLIFRKVIIILSFILGILIVLNYLLFLYIDRLKVEQDRLSNNVLSELASEKTAVSIDRKVTYYKEILKLRKLLAPKVSFVFENVIEGIKLDELRITFPSFEITATAKNIYDFTKLITNYLSGDYVSEIVLKKANFNPQTKEYEFTIGGVFK